METSRRPTARTTAFRSASSNNIIIIVIIVVIVIRDIDIHTEVIKEQRVKQD